MKKTIQEAIDTERGRQKLQFSETSEDLLTVPEWGSILARQLGLAMPHTSKDSTPLDLQKRQAVRIAAVAVAWLESLERREARAMGAVGYISQGKGF